MKAKMVKTLLKTLQIHESRDEDDGLVLRAALAVIVAALIFVRPVKLSAALDIAAACLMILGTTWLRKVGKRWEKEDELSPGGVPPKGTESTVRATAQEEKKRSGRARNKPPAGNHPLHNSPEGSRDAASSSCRPRAMVKMMKVERPRARPHEPWWHPPFDKPPVGFSDRWMVVENFVVRIHCKLRYQRCHPIHSDSSYPLRDEQVLTGRRVTIKYLNGEQPGRPTEDSWVDPPTKEDRQDNKVEGRWTGYTFFELREPARDAEVVSYYVGERPIGEWARRTETLPPHLRIPHDMRATEAAQARAPDDTCGIFRTRI